MMSSRNEAHGTNLLVLLILFYFSNFGIFFAAMWHSTHRPFNRTRLTGHVVNGEILNRRLKRQNAVIPAEEAVINHASVSKLFLFLNAQEKMTPYKVLKPSLPRRRLCHNFKAAFYRFTSFRA
jgi:hypothetical protein